jgi:hypothetical protein
MLELGYIRPLNIAQWWVGVDNAILNQIPQRQDISRNPFPLKPALAETQRAILYFNSNKIRSM